VVDIAELGPRLLDPGLEQDPACVVRRVEHCNGGYRWLLDRWAEIRGLLDSGEPWDDADRLKFVRLSGKEPA
jgi:hypothetical protein